MTYQTYRLCRNKETISRIKEEEEKYSLPASILKTKIDLFTFINEIIQDCKNDYALVCHDDVTLPKTISMNIENCIKSVNEYIGKDNWAVVGNAGVEYLSKNVHTLLSDPHTKYLPPKYNNPIIAESLDGNTLLLNVKNLRKQNVLLPKEISGFHLYDLILCTEAYKKNLVCLISPWLYVIHSSPGSYESFKEAIEIDSIQNYFRKNFSNHTITSINDNIPVQQTYNSLSTRRNSKKSFEEIINNTVLGLFKEKPCVLNIITRIHLLSPKTVRLLSSIETLKANLPKNSRINVVLSINNLTKEETKTFINDLKERFKTINIIDIYLENKGTRYPRVSSLSNAIDFCYSRNANSYSWFVDYDDFVLPEIGRYLPYLLYQNEIIIGESVVFNEEWEDNSETPIKSIIENIYHSDLATRIITGSNFLPICSVIYKTEILKNTLDNSYLLGEYYEDYAIALLTIPQHNQILTKIKFAGISYHGENTISEKDRTHWNYSYATFLSEIINKGILDKNTYLYLQNNIVASDEFEGFKRGKIWKGLMAYRRLRSLVSDLVKRGNK